jgi:hypothetical protein
MLREPVTVALLKQSSLPIRAPARASRPSAVKPVAAVHDAADGQAVADERLAARVRQAGALQLDAGLDDGVDQADLAVGGQALAGQAAGDLGAAQAERLAAGVGEAGAGDVDRALDGRAVQADPPARAEAGRRAQRAPDADQPRVQRGAAGRGEVGAGEQQGAADRRGAQADLAFGAEPGVEDGGAVDAGAVGVEGRPAGVGQPRPGQQEPPPDPRVRQAHLAVGGEAPRVQPGRQLDPLGVERDGAGVGQARAVEDAGPADVRAVQQDLAGDLRVGGVDVAGHGQRVGLDAGEAGRAQRQRPVDPGADELQRAVDAAVAQPQQAVDLRVRGGEAGQPGAGQAELPDPGRVQGGRLVERAVAHQHRVPDLGEGQVEHAGDPRAGEPHRRDLPRAGRAGAQQQRRDDLAADRLPRAGQIDLARGRERVPEFSFRVRQILDIHLAPCIHRGRGAAPWHRP